MISISLFACKSKIKNNEDIYQVELNDYLKLKIDSIDLIGDNIRIKLTNISNKKVSASFSKDHFEGELIVKIDEKELTFYHKIFRLKLLTSFWLNEPLVFKSKEEYFYNSKLEDFIDLQETINLKKYIQDNANKTIFYKVLGNQQMVYPTFPESANITKFSAAGPLRTNWQTFELDIQSR